MGESLTDAVHKLLDRIDKMEKKIEIISKTSNEYLIKLPEEYKENSAYSEEFWQGKYKPHKEYKNCREMKKCNENGTWPHLFHTLDPQLNNISDMIVELLECCCHKKEQNIHNELEETKNKLNNIIIHLKDKPTDNKKEMEDQCLKLEEIIKLLQDINKKKQNNRCLTLEDIKPFLKQGGKIKENKS